MPYTITASAEGCSGYAVVKQGENTPVEGGCHALKSAAIAHMVALEIAYQDELEDELEEEEEEEEEEERQEPNLVAPAFMRQSARRGLRLHEEGYSGDGLKPQTVEDARKMAESTALSEDKWRRIGPWIARHTGDLDAVQGDEITPGLVAMLLWGGGSSKSSARRAQDYAERLVARLDEKRYDPDQPRDEDGKFGSGGGGGGDEDDDTNPVDLSSPDFVTKDLGISDISEQDADRIAKVLDDKDLAFSESGGTITEPIEEEGMVKYATDSVAAQYQSLGREDQERLETGKRMTEGALIGAREPHLISIAATDDDGNIAGAIAYTKQPINGEGDVVRSGGVITIENLGSMGIVDGTGSKLFGEAVRHAAQTNSGIALEALDQSAENFWKGMGFAYSDEQPVDFMYLTPQSVQQIAGRI